MRFAASRPTTPRPATPAIEVSKLIEIDGRFYDLKISPAGDKLSLDRTTTPLGNVTNPNDGFRAVIYSDKGVS